MKILFLLPLIFTPFWETAIQQQSQQLITGNVAVPVSVTFGHVQTCQTQSGLCNVTTGNSNEFVMPVGCPAKIWIDDQQHLILEIRRNDMSVEAADLQFGQGYFYQSGHLPIAPTLLQRLGSLDPTRTIWADFYPIEQTPEVIRIKF